MHRQNPADASSVARYLGGVAKVWVIGVVLRYRVTKARFWPVCNQQFPSGASMGNDPSPDNRIHKEMREDERPDAPRTHIVEREYGERRGDAE